MNEGEFKVIALSLIIIIGFVVVYPMIVESRGVVEPFSELGVLGPNLKLGDYPKEIGVNQVFRLYLYIGNHMGGPEYYRVLAKVGDVNSTISDADPSNAPVLASWDCVLADESNNTLPINLSIPHTGLNQRLVFELYRFDTGSGMFTYHQRWTQIWINVYEAGG